MKQVLYSPSARQDFKRLDKPTQKRVVEKIDWHAETGGGVKRLTGGSLAGTPCLRSGDWRILLEYEGEDRLLVMRILHRSVAYK